MSYGKRTRSRTSKMSPELERILRKQRKRFIKEFGREPGPNDPVFFDPHAGEPTPMSEEGFDADVLRGMLNTGMPPEIVYAYMKTGLLLAEEYRSNYSPEAIAEWQAAIDEYFEQENKMKGKAQ